MKQIIAFGLAVTFSFFLFVLMHMLIDNDAKAVVAEVIEPVVINVKLDDKPVETIIRKKTPKLEPLKKLPEQTKSLVQKPEQKIVRVAIRDVAKTTFGDSFKPLVGGTENLATQDSANNSSSELMPRIRIEPMYPRDAAVQGKQGFVTLSFDINSYGDPTNIQVVEAEPRGYFEQSAKKALRKWKYFPKKEEGTAVGVFNQNVTLEFKLEES